MARGRSEEARIRRHESRNEGTTGGLLQNDGAWHWPGTGTGMPAVTDVRVRVWVRLTSNKMLASEMKERDSANQRKLNNLLGSSRVPMLLSLSVSEASHQSQSQTPNSSRDRASSSSPTPFLSCTTAIRSDGPFGGRTERTACLQQPRSKQFPLFAVSSDAVPSNLAALP